MPRTIVRRSVTSLAAFALLLSVGACGANASSSTNSDKNLKTVSFMLSWAPDTNHIGAYVAQKKGYFAEEGLNVDILATSQAGAEQAVSTGAANFALSNTFNVGVANIKNAGLKLLAQIQQRTSAIWCSLASNTSIKSPKDFDGKTFATFGANESDAVIKRMIQTDGGKGEFDKVTVGTSTFQTLSSGKADFGGFYTTWEGVQAELNGPKLNCWNEPDYGVPGNADEIGIITSDAEISKDPRTVQGFTRAIQKGYTWAYEHPDEAAQILVDSAKDANLDIKFVKRSMQIITEGNYWGPRDEVKAGTFTIGTPDPDGAQKYFDFVADSGAYTDQNNQVVTTPPVATQQIDTQFLVPGADIVKAIQ
ncbi:ABC transporter substrate-binding protein [Alloscardovia macacae]|uniref:Thiamine pyrimidine synthase n=1 Tax=Alloscardovia macacae TaxID=1160091 RepID=A0A1Y2SYT1_9BIFI|nr:ABC transporter substrate-binding protein [Alloscardovia macacae]OTA27441.1 ABC transporter substrate-binding protein [Alloscardovia macacae]OTA29452.1 ABC transporter substrate-binding protein [Alloscardovia macacae]